MPSLSDLFATCPSGHIVIESLTTEEEERVYEETYGTDPETCPKLCCYGQRDTETGRLRMAPTSPKVPAQDGAADTDSGCYRAQSNGHGALGACAAQEQRLARAAWKCIQALLAIAVFAAHSGCSVSGTWHAEPELQDSATEAAKLWCDASGGRYCPIVDDAHGSQIRLVPVETLPHEWCGSYTRDTDAFGNTTSELILVGDAHGRMRPDGAPLSGTPICAFLLPDGSWASDEHGWVVTIAHELGHAAGLPDLTWPGEGEGTLMGSDRSVLLPTQRDVELLDSY